MRNTLHTILGESWRQALGLKILFLPKEMGLFPFFRTIRHVDLELISVAVRYEI